jgi:hypothetical protein
MVMGRFTLSIEETGDKLGDGTGFGMRHLPASATASPNIMSAIGDKKPSLVTLCLIY